MMRLIAAVLAVVVALVTIPIVTSVVHDAQAAPASDQFSVTTGTGQTSATVTLSRPHFHNDTTHISVTSNNQNDNPSVTAYNPSTRQVTVGGLAPSATRTLTVRYEVDAMEGFPGAAAILGMVPLLWVAGAIVLAVAMLVIGRR
jgi:beta-lactamase regulating signal transducer with metallopeptidase domain